jgi:Rrf2 family protein
MLTQTSEIAIRALVYLGLSGTHEPVPPRLIASAIACSPTYLAKTLRLLGRVGIVRSRKGAHGGVWLGRAPADISLLNIVEACQGLLIADYCQEVGPQHRAAVCAFHHAMQEVFEATRATLSRWTLADLLRKPAPAGAVGAGRSCKLKIAPLRRRAPESSHA